MGLFERQADQYADEAGRLEAIEIRIDRQWQAEREELASQLAAGEALTANGRQVLDFEDVIDRVCASCEAEHRAALLLSILRPELAGHHIKQLVEREAQSLVDQFADAFKTDLESDHG